jgi:hypothetical protein
VVLELTHAQHQHPVVVGVAVVGMHQEVQVEQRLLPEVMEEQGVRITVLVVREVPMGVAVVEDEQVMLLTAQGVMGQQE